MWRQEKERFDDLVKDNGELEKQIMALYSKNWGWAARKCQGPLPAETLPYPRTLANARADDGAI